MYCRCCNIDTAQPPGRDSTIAEFHFLEPITVHLATTACHASNRNCVPVRAPYIIEARLLWKERRTEVKTDEKYECAFCSVLEIKVTKKNI